MKNQKKRNIEIVERNYGGVRKIGRSIARYKMGKGGIIGKNDANNPIPSKGELQRLNKSGKNVKYHRSYFAETWREWVFAE